MSFAFELEKGYNARVSEQYKVDVTPTLKSKSSLTAVADWIQSNVTGTPEDFLADVQQTYKGWNPDAALKTYNELSRGAWTKYAPKKKGSTPLGKRALAQNKARGIKEAVTMVAPAAAGAASYFAGPLLKPVVDEVLKRQMPEAIEIREQAMADYVQGEGPGAELVKRGAQYVTETAGDIARSAVRSKYRDISRGLGESELGESAASWLENAAGSTAETAASIASFFPVSAVDPISQVRDIAPMWKQFVEDIQTDNLKDNIQRGDIGRYVGYLLMLAGAGHSAKGAVTNAKTGQLFKAGIRAAKTGDTGKAASLFIEGMKRNPEYMKLTPEQRTQAGNAIRAALATDPDAFAKLKVRKEGGQVVLEAPEAPVVRHLERTKPTEPVKQPTTAAEAVAQIRSDVDSLARPLRQHDTTTDVDAALAKAEKAGPDVPVAPSKVVAAKETVSQARSKVVEPAPVAKAQDVKPGTTLPEVKYGEVLEMPTNAMKRDPARFQYKESNPPGDTPYNPQFADIIDVWRDPADGKIYVVNGHKRHEWAERDGVPTVRVQFIDAPNASQARTFGALKNIAQNSGTAIDAAKVFRETGMTPELLAAHGVSLRGAIARDGLGLSRLSDDLFYKVTSGKLGVERGALIGRLLSDHADQRALVQMLERKAKQGKKITNDVIPELVREVTNAPKTTSKQRNLFGEEELAQNLALERAELSAYIKNELRSDIDSFGTAIKQADRLKRGQNVINIEQSSAIRDQAARVMEIYDSLAGYEGPINELLNKAAQELAAGGNENAIKAELYKSVHKTVSETLTRGTGTSSKSSGTRPAKGTRSQDAGNQPELTPQPPAKQSKPSTPKPKKSAKKPQSSEPKPVAEFGKKPYEAKQQSIPGSEIPEDFQFVPQRAPESKVVAKEPPPKGQRTIEGKVEGEHSAPEQASATAAQSPTPKVTDDILAKLDKWEQSALQRIKERNTGRFTANIDPMDMIDIAIYGAAKLGKGIVKFADWSVEMVKTFGEEIKPHLEAIYKRSVKLYNEDMRASLGEGAPVIKLPSSKPAPKPIEPTKGFGVKNASTEVERAMMGLPEVDKPAYRSIQEVYETGKALVDSGDIDPRALATAVVEKPRALQANEVTALGYDGMRLKNELADLRKARDEALAAGNEATVQALTERIRATEHNLDITTQALQIAGTEQSMAFQVRKVLVAEDYSLETLLQNARATAYEKTGKAEISAATEAKITAEHAKLVELQEQYDKLVARLRKQAQQSEQPVTPQSHQIEQRIVKKPSDFKRIEWGEDNKTFTREGYERILRELGENRNRLYSGIDPANVQRVVYFFGFHIEAGVRFSYRTAHAYLKSLGLTDGEIRKGYKLASQDKRLAQAKKRLRAEIEVTKEYVAKGERIPKPDPVEYDIEAVQLKAKLVEQRARLDALTKPPKPLSVQIRDTISTTFNAPLGLLAGFLDDSAVLRQNIIMPFENPRAWAKGFKAGLSAMFSERNALYMDAQLRSHGSFPLAQRSKLEYTPIDAMAPLAKAEEGSMFARAAGRLPIAGKVLKRILRPFDRAYTTTQNVIRHEAFYRMADVMGDRWTAQDYAGYAHNLNVFSGRGSLGKLSAYQAEFNAVLISTRKVAADMQLFALPFVGTKASKIAAIKTLLKATSALTTFAVLVNASGKAKVGLNPNSADFMHLRIDNTRIDLTGGRAGVFRTAFRALKALWRHSRWGDADFTTPTALDELWRHFSYKVNPGWSATKELFYGEDFAGNPTTPVQTAKKLVIPWSVQDTVEAYNEAGAGMGIVVAAAGFWGLGAKTYFDPRGDIRPILESLDNDYADVEKLAASERDKKAQKLGYKSWINLKSKRTQVRSAYQKLIKLDKEFDALETTPERKHELRKEMEAIVAEVLRNNSTKSAWSLGRSRQRPPKTKPHRSSDLTTHKGIFPFVAGELS